MDQQELAEHLDRYVQLYLYPYSGPSQEQKNADLTLPQGKHWEDMKVTHAEAVAKLATGRHRICVNLDNEDFGCLDYDRHAPDSNAAELFEQHWNEQPIFFENAYIEESQSGGLHVYFKKDAVLPKNPFGHHVDVLHGNTGRLLQVYPTPGMSIIQTGTGLQPLPEGFVPKVNKATRQATKRTEHAVGRLFADWEPEVTDLTSAQKFLKNWRKPYTSDHTQKVPVLCDGICNTYHIRTRDTGTGWTETSRHQEIGYVLQRYAKEKLGDPVELGPAEWDELIALYVVANDAWHCSNHAPKWADIQQMKSDLRRVLDFYGFDDPDDDVISSDKHLPDDRLFFADEPLAVGVMGFTETLKTTLVRTVALDEWFRVHPNTPVLWLSDDDSAAMTRSRIKPEYRDHVHVVGAGDLGLATYVDGMDIDLPQKVRRLVRSHGLKSTDKFLLVIDPYRAFIVDSAKADEYKTAYRLGKVLSRQFPNAYRLEVHHMSKGDSGRGSNGTAFGSMAYQAKLRLWVKCYEELDGLFTVQFGGNLRKDEETYSMVPGGSDDFPVVELKPHTLTQDFKDTMRALLDGASAPMPQDVQAFREYLAKNWNVGVEDTGAYIKVGGDVQ